MKLEQIEEAKRRERERREEERREFVADIHRQLEAKRREEEQAGRLTMMEEDGPTCAERCRGFVKRVLSCCCCCCCCPCGGKAW